MNYEIYKPALALQPFIDSYWHISGHVQTTEAVTLMPEGSINLFINLGENITSTRFNNFIKHEGIFLVGPMMQTDVQLLKDEVLLFGIRFKPGRFTHFYKNESLEQAANLFYDFPRKDFPDIKKTMRYFVSYLDQFYLNRLSFSRSSITNIISDITQNSNSMKVEALAKKYFTTERQLERQFKQYVGLSPKEFIDLERFNKAFALLQNSSKQRLSDIAWECGYYDHAHLTNDFKRFTGKSPSAFFLSDFSKKISEDSL